jgi:hypothetical protein
MSTAGGNATTNTPGTGGYGYCTSIESLTNCYCGGGGGGQQGGSTFGAAGESGGGNGGANSAATSGQANTGGGGGGGDGFATGGGNGGSGWVVLRYSSIYTPVVENLTYSIDDVTLTEKILFVTAGSGTVKFT